MTLQVPIEQFAATVKRLLPNAPAFVCPQETRTLVTSADPARSLIVAALCRESCSHVKENLKSQGLEAYDGAWGDGAETAPFQEETVVPYVAAVSYKTEADTPGIWVDAYAELPTQVSVLRNLYDEFRGTGELAEVSFEEFVRVAAPNVVIVSPEDLAGYLKSKET